MSRPKLSAVLPNLSQLREAALSRAPVSLGPRRTASPHEYYRYPARFSPEMAAAAIAAFSSPGDLVADYFLGGGTTLVEARLAGRIGVGSDLNSLATFVSRVKTFLFSSADLGKVREWAERATSNSSEKLEWPADEQTAGYFRNFSDAAFAEHRRVLFAALGALSETRSVKARSLARCALLRTAQWGLDMRSEVPTAHDLREVLVSNAMSMADAARTATENYRRADRGVPSGGLPRTLILNQGLPGIAGHSALSRHPAPQLILTSPPYPGVYVTYHRWKLRGRLETPLPYFIAGQQDGHGLAYYTMAARSDRSQDTYFNRLEAAFNDVAKLCSPDTWIVQIVGFNDVDGQFQRYLHTMNRAGFSEVMFDQLATENDGRLWRDVPGRRWWARAGDRSAVAQHTAREVVLIHRRTVWT